MRLQAALLALAAWSATAARAGAHEAPSGARSVEEHVAVMRDGDMSKGVDAMMALQAMGRSAVPGLIAVTRHSDERMRTWAASLLEDFPGPGAGSALADMAERDPVFINRYRAALALSRMGAAGDPEARQVLPILVAKLGATLDSADTRAAGDAVDVLGGIGEPAGKLLIAKLAHPRLEVRIRVVSELDSFDTGALPALSMAADAPDRRVRMVALDTLSIRAIKKRPGRDDAVAIIKRKLDDPDPAVRQAAARALEDATRR
jgi:HEAT repeat protein